MEVDKTMRVPPVDRPWPDEYFDRHIETMRKDELERIQWKKLKYIVDYAYRYSEFYHRRFNEAGIKPDDIRSYRDFIRKVPKFTKDDLREWIERTGDPYAGISGVREEELLYVCASTGTTGTPTYYALDKIGAHEFAEAWARSLWSMRLRPWMRFGNIALPFPWFTNLYTEATKLVGVKNVFGPPPYAHPIFASQVLDFLTRYNPDYVWLTPPPALAVLEEAKKQGIDIAKHATNLLFMNTAGEAITPGVRKQFIEEFGLLDFFDISGCGEGQYGGGECFVHDGCHIWMDKWFVEIVDPKTGEPIEEPTESDAGSIVVTNLFSRGLIYIRCDTEDFGWIKTEKCECGRTHPRVEIVDRSLYVIEVAGKFFTPNHVREVIERIPERRSGDFTIVKYAPKMDRLKLKIAPTDVPETEEEWKDLEERTKSALEKELGVSAEIVWVEYSELPLSGGWKIRRIVEEYEK